LMAGKLYSKFCPVLYFHKDEKFKKTMETMRLINQAVSEFSQESPSESEPHGRGQDEMEDKDLTVSEE
jgi:hypothetical protein